MALSSEFIHDEQKQAQWKGFLKRLGISEKEMTLERIIADISKFVMPLINSLKNKEEFGKRWHNGKNWIYI